MNGKLCKRMRKEVRTNYPDLKKVVYRQHKVRKTFLIATTDVGEEGVIVHPKTGVGLKPVAVDLVINQLDKDCQRKKYQDIKRYVKMFKKRNFNV